MVEIMTREASSCDLKELVGKFIPEAIGELLPLVCVSYDSYCFVRHQAYQNVV